MNPRSILAWAATVVIASTGVAAAQAPTINPEDAVEPLSVVEGPGIKVGEGTVLHPVLGMEVGVVSNVFYEDQSTVAGGLIRLLAEVGTGSLSAQRLAPVEREEQSGPVVPNLGDFQYRTDLALNYDYYPSTNENVRSQGGLGTTFLFRGIVNPGKPLQFAVVENFSRVLRATNFESADNINRDINSLKLQMQWAPRGRSLSGVIHYENRLDIFEKDTQQFANRFQNSLGLRVNWQWLPKTRVFADVTQGVFTGIGSSTKVTSYPLTTVAGIQTLLTPTTTLASQIGYTNGFYSSGPSFSALVFGTQFGYRYTELGRIAFTYNYLHQDSINANYFRDHHFAVRIQHGFAPFLVVASAELMLRDYQGLVVMSGPTERQDVIVSGLGEVRYNFRNWLAGAVNYRVTAVSTDYAYDVGGGMLDNPGFQRHEVTAGVRAAY